MLPGNGMSTQNCLTVLGKAGVTSRGCPVNPAVHVCDIVSAMPFINTHVAPGMIPPQVVGM